MGRRLARRRAAGCRVASADQKVVSVSNHAAAHPCLYFSSRYLGAGWRPVSCPLGFPNVPGSSAVPLLAQGSGDRRLSGDGYRRRGGWWRRRWRTRDVRFLNDPYSAGHQGRRSKGAGSQALRGHPGTRRPKGLPPCSTIAHSPPHRVPRFAARRSQPSWPCRRCLRLRRPLPKAPTSRLRHPTRAKACRSPPTARPVGRGHCPAGPPASSAWARLEGPACSRGDLHRAVWRCPPAQTRLPRDDTSRRTAFPRTRRLQHAGRMPGATIAITGRAVLTKHAVAGPGRTASYQ
jgi:hypothetical protein